MFKININTSGLRINGPAETFHAHESEAFNHVAHIFHLEWHGIRSATSCLPGHKIGISANSTIEGDAIRRIHGHLYEHKVKKIIYQGFSKNAEILARSLKSLMREHIEQFVITHVTSTQFEFAFEVDQQISILSCLRDKIVNRLGSVKPNFHTVIPSYWSKTIYNAPPNLIRYGQYHKKDRNIAFIPLENTLRKNLYTNIIGAQNAKSVDQVWTVNHPSGLENLADLSKCRTVGYQRGSNLYDRMSEATIVLNCTLAECQPMTQLEALAVGTPCLTGKLGLAEMSDHRLTEFLEVSEIDSPHSITAAIEKILAYIHSDEQRFAVELRGYLDYRTNLALKSLSSFLDI
ncbi:glycosyltransferase [Methylorubrum extorquens]